MGKNGRLDNYTWLKERSCFVKIDEDTCNWSRGTKFRMELSNGYVSVSKVAIIEYLRIYGEGVQLKGSESEPWGWNKARIVYIHAIIGMMEDKMSKTYEVEVAMVKRCWLRWITIARTPPKRKVLLR